MGLASAFFGWLFLQSYFTIPDGYAIDVDRDPPRYAAPCDRDNYVSINVPGGQFIGGARMALRYDEEDRAMGSDAESVMFRVQWRF